MKVMNIGIIIRNDHNDTFPVALTPEMVSIIQKLLTSLPVGKSNLVDPQGRNVKTNQSIAIIPREVTFDWEGAYAPMLPAEEQRLMKVLSDRYVEIEKEMELNPKEEDTGGILIPQGINVEDPDDEEVMPDNVELLNKNAVDPLNPMNLECKATGTANVDEKEKAGNDCTVTPDPLHMSGKSSL